MPTLGLSMIVRNAEKDLPACLASARSLVDQIVIADTGSTDQTRVLAAASGATVVDFPWNDHFAEARNAALRPLSTDWVLVLDADEELAPDAAEALPRLLAGSAGIGGYQVTIRNYIPERFSIAFEQISRVNCDPGPRAARAPAWIEHCMIRLFRRHPGIFFAGRIHEGVDESIRQLGLKIEKANFRIRHFGQLADESRRRSKSSYYLELGQRKTAEQPENAYAWLELGFEYFRAERYAESLDCMNRCVALRHWALAAFYIARIQAIQGQSEAALATLEVVPDHHDLAFLRHALRGDLLHNLGRLREARQAYLAALRFGSGRSGADPTGREGLIESKLGYTEVRLGLVRMGLARLARAVDQMPDFLENHDRLVKACVSLGRDREAADAAEAILSRFASEKIYLRAAVLRLRAGDSERALALLRTGLERFPGSADLSRMLGAPPSPAAPLLSAVPLTSSPVS